MLLDRCANLFWNGCVFVVCSAKGMFWRQVLQVAAPAPQAKPDESREADRASLRPSGAASTVSLPVVFSRVRARRSNASTRDEMRRDRPGCAAAVRTDRGEWTERGGAGFSGCWSPVAGTRRLGRL